MRRFSTIVNINESDNNTYDLCKTIEHKPEGFQDIKDMLDFLKESYSDIENISITTGYTTIKSLSSAHSVNALQVIGKKKIGGFFKDGKVPDKWQFIIKVEIKYFPLKSDKNQDIPKWADDKMHDIDVLDVVAKRHNAVKTLAKRCYHYGVSDIKVTFGSSMSNEFERISLLLLFE